MRGVLALSVIYVVAPLVALWLVSLVSSGFPIAPVLIGAALWWQFQRDQSHC